MFGKSTKSKPTVTTDRFKLVFDQKDQSWNLAYREINFLFPGPELTLPTQKTLDTYITWVETNRDHIDEQIEEMVSSWTDVQINASAAHIASIEVERADRIVVMILGDDTWGDVGYDLWIENGSITKEGFAD